MYTLYGFKPVDPSPSPGNPMQFVRKDQSGKLYTKFPPCLPSPGGRGPAAVPGRAVRHDEARWPLKARAPRIALCGRSVGTWVVHSLLNISCCAHLSIFVWLGCGHGVLSTESMRFRLARTNHSSTMPMGPTRNERAITFNTGHCSLVVGARSRRAILGTLPACARSLRAPPGPPPA